MKTQLLLQKEDHVTARFLDWIWHIKGSLALASGQSADDAMAKLGSLFHQAGTTHERIGDTLTFSKKDQAAQDKMSIFDGGVLKIEKGSAGSVLRYHLTSRALLFCFLAPLLFLSFAGLTVAAAKFTSSPAREAAKKDEKKNKIRQLHWIDKALGAPAPEKPKKDDKSKEDGKKPKPTAAYVFAGIFAALYVAGRILEARLVKSLFRKKLFAS